MKEQIIKWSMAIIIGVAIFFAGWVARIPISVSESMFMLSQHGIISNDDGTIFISNQRLTHDDIKYLNVVSKHYYIEFE